jgi:hypothetical protein
LPTGRRDQIERRIMCLAAQHKLSFTRQ